MRKPLRSIKIVVRGFNINCHLVNDKEFESKHKDDKFSAMTLWETKSIEFKASKLTESLVRHEMLHIFFYASLTETADIDNLAVEECIAEMFAHFGPEMILLSNKVYKTLNKEK